MHELHPTVAQLIIQDRIREAELRRAGLAIVRSRRAARRAATPRRRLRSLVHPGPALARLMHPE